MMETKWTIKSIMRTFEVPRLLALRIQKEHPAYQGLCALLAAHRAL